MAAIANASQASILQEPSANCSSVRPGQVRVEHAQNLLAGGMCVTLSIGALRLILDGADDGEHTLSLGPVDAEPIGAIQTGQGLLVSMAAIAGFGILIDDTVSFRRICGITDLTLPVEDANPNHARSCAIAEIAWCKPSRSLRSM